MGKQSSTSSKRIGVGGSSLRDSGGSNLEDLASQRAHGRKLSSEELRDITRSESCLLTYGAHTFLRKTYLFLALDDLFHESNGAMLELWKQQTHYYDRTYS